MRFPALALALGFVIGAIVFIGASIVIAWTGPTAPPPAGNVAAPLNVGTTDQVKDAGLAVNALAVFGNAILSGASRYLNFGDSAGEGGYGIRDNAGVMEFKDSGGPWKSFATSVASATSHGGQMFTASGTFLVPPDVTSVKVTLIGGGGGGGTGSCAGGGGGGGTVIGATEVTPQTTMTVIVGTGGATANNGGTSSFGDLSAGGGAAGGISPDCGPSYFPDPPAPGGAGGAASDGYVNFPGSEGSSSVVLTSCDFWGSACQDSYSPGSGGASIVPFFSVESSLIPDWGKGGKGGESGKSGVVLIEW